MKKVKSLLRKEYIKVSKIIGKSSNIINAKALIENDNTQVYFNMPSVLKCVGKGYIILDFAKEYHGGIRIITASTSNTLDEAKIRIRFGESVSEACSELHDSKNSTNNHSVRDFEAIIPNLSDQEFGKTGFRFVRIDFLSEDVTYEILNVFAAVTFYNKPFVGSFKCSDKLVNKIYETCKYTIYLNMQDNLYEGIKRDRLVWVGDMYPEVTSVMNLFGDSTLIHKAINESRIYSPLPKWIDNIPSYSLWYIFIIYEHYMRNKDEKLIDDNIDYIEGLLELFDKVVDDNGNIDYKKNEGFPYGIFFVDWPSSVYEHDSEYGNRYILILAYNALKKIYSYTNRKENPLIQKMLDKITIPKQEVFKKQIVSLGYLANQIDSSEAKEKLLKDGVKGQSTFMSYFIYKAMNKLSDIDTTLESMKEYYGGMLSIGATTFFEDFDIEWLQGSGRIDKLPKKNQKDFHGDHGAFCYQGFRHSLCHGWSSGPISFLVEDVLGVKVLEPGCSKLEIKPNLRKLEYAKGIYPTPYGKVYIDAKKVDGKVVTTIKAPKEITIIK